MLLSIISAVLLILIFPKCNISYLAFIAFIPLFLAIQDKTPKKAFLISYLSGFLFYLGTLYWVYYVTGFGLVALCLYLALYFGILGYIFNRTARRRGAILLIPAIWIILEYIQSRIFTGFGWTLMGYSQYKILPFIQIADFSGVYGVSFLIMTVNVAIYKILKRSFREIILAGLVIALAVGYGTMRINEKQDEKIAKVSVVQGNIPQDLKWDPGEAESIMDKYIMLTENAALDKPELIIWPETSFPVFFEKGEEFTEEVLDLCRRINIPILLGANTERGPDSFNSALLISEKGDIVGKYDKIHLVPFGEYVPFSDRFPVLHSLVLGELGEFTKGEEFKVFSHQYDFSVLICYEDIFPELAKKFVQKGARLLVVITNDAWYGRSGMPYQHAACSVFRAIENRVPIVRCANTGYSCFIDSRGRIYDAVEENGTHLFIAGHKTAGVTLR